MGVSYLEIKEIGDTGKTKIFSVVSNKINLGKIKWFSNWRRYCFYPNHDTLFDCNCINQISEFIQLEMNKRK